MDSDAPDPDDEGEGAVRPEDLDFSEDRRVMELDDRRYVVATADDGTPSPPEGEGDGDEATDGSDGESAGGDDAADGRPDRAAAREALIEYVEGRAPSHGFVVVGSFDDRVDGAEAFADDLPAVFGEFVDWYATNVDAGTPPAEVLGILLVAAGVPVKYPVHAFERYLSAHDLSADDPIEDLLSVAREEGFTLPPVDE